MNFVDEVSPLVGLFTKVLPSLVGYVIFVACAVAGLGGALSVKLGGLIVFEVAVGSLKRGGKKGKIIIVTFNTF